MPIGLPLWIFCCEITLIGISTLILNMRFASSSSDFWKECNDLFSYLPIEIVKLKPREILSLQNQEIYYPRVNSLISPKGKIHSSISKLQGGSSERRSTPRAKGVPCSNIKRCLERKSQTSEIVRSCEGTANDLGRLRIRLQLDYLFVKNLCIIKAVVKAESYCCTSFFFVALHVTMTCPWCNSRWHWKGKRITGYPRTTECPSIDSCFRCKLKMTYTHPLPPFLLRVHQGIL